MLCNCMKSLKKYKEYTHNGALWINPAPATGGEDGADEPGRVHSRCRSGCGFGSAAPAIQVAQQAVVQLIFVANPFEHAP